MRITIHSDRHFNFAFTAVF